MELNHLKLAYQTSALPSGTARMGPRDGIEPPISSLPRKHVAIYTFEARTWGRIGESNSGMQDTNLPLCHLS